MRATQRLELFFIQNILDFTFFNLLGVNIDNEANMK